MRVLIVDNDISTAETIKAVVATGPGIQVGMAYSGKEALEKMKTEGKYDLLLLDIMMPGISGIDVCRLMTQDEKLKAIPVLLVSALPIASKAFQDSLGEFGELSVVKDVVEKPFEIDELLAKVKAAAGNH